MNQSTDKIIIAGFPGVGKTKSAEILRGIAIDCESSDFHWMDPKAEVKTSDPEWPYNYLKYIKMLTYETDSIKGFRDLLYVCCSTHAEVLQRLRQERIPFVIVVPEDKEDTVARYRARGNSEAFIQKLEENWDTWMKNFESYDMPIVRLKPDMYLSDLLNRSSTFDYLVDKINDVIQYVLLPEEEDN